MYRWMIKFVHVNILECHLILFCIILLLFHAFEGECVEFVYACACARICVCVCVCGHMCVSVYCSVYYNPLLIVIRGEW